MSSLRRQIGNASVADIVIAVLGFIVIAAVIAFFLLAWHAFNAPTGGLSPGG